MTPYYNGSHIPCLSVFCLASGAYSGNLYFCVTYIALIWHNIKSWQLKIKFSSNFLIKFLAKMTNRAQIQKSIEGIASFYLSSLGFQFGGLLGVNSRKNVKFQLNIMKMMPACDILGHGL